ncbi:MAG: hypothetical protein RSE62_12640 [Citrobacter sp.]
MRVKHKVIIVAVELSLDKTLDIEAEVERLMLVVKGQMRDENYLEGWRVEEKE